MSLLQALLVLVLIGFVCFLAFAVMIVLTIRKVARATQRRAAFLGNRGVLQLQSWMPSPARPISAMRLELQRDVFSATDAIDAAWEAGRPVAQLRGFAQQLGHSAGDLDLDLSVIAGEPDATRRAALMDSQRERIDTLHSLCAQLRHGVLLAGGEAGGARVTALCSQINDEIDLLRLRAEAYRDLFTS